MAEQTQRCSIDNNNIFCFVNEARHVKDMVMVINLQKQPKMILENPIKSQISNFQKRIPENPDISIKSSTNCDIKKMVCIWMCDMKDIIWIWK